MTALIFFGVEEAGTGAGTVGARDVAVSAGGALAGGAASAGAIGTTAPDPTALGGEALWLGEIGAVFGGS